MVQGRGRVAEPAGWNYYQGGKLSERLCEGIDGREREMCQRQMQRAE